MKKIYLGIALTMALASCTNEELVNSMNESKLEVTMESNHQLSRVGFDRNESWSFFWHKGDAIWVNGGIMSTQDEDKSKSATFRGYGINTNSGYAVYPHAKAQVKEESQLTWNFPETYNYSDMDDDFFQSAQGIPMYAKVVNGNASFKHLGAIVAFKFNDWTFKGEHVFTLTSSKKITGNFTTDLSTTTPELKVSDENVEEDVVTVTYNRPDNASTTSVVFYVPIPTGTYDLDIKMAVGGELIYTNSKSIGVKRGDIVWADLNESTLVADNREFKSVESVTEITSDVLTTEKDELIVQVTEEVTGEQNIILPSALGTVTTTFMFEYIADDAKITINNEQNGSYSGRLIVEIPEGQTIPEVEANIPDGEVYIKQGTVTKLVVSSKENTTIIGTGVKVNELVVNKGNVRIEKDGEITKIENKTGATLYITNAGGNLPSELPENTIVVYEDTEHSVVLNSKYSANNFADLMSYSQDVLNISELSFELSSGKYAEVINVTGGKNIIIQPQVAGQEVSIAGLDHQSNGTPSTVVVKNITLDNTLQTEGWFTGTAQNIKPCVGAWGGNFTFEGCKFIVEGTYGKETGVMTWWTVDNNGTTLNFNGCTFNGYDNHESARAMQIYGHVDLMVENCTFNTYKDYSLKYVGQEGHTATFNNNKIYNTKYFVELGSSLYPGKDCKVYFSQSTLGDNIGNYTIANEEGQTVYVDNIKEWPIVHYEVDANGNIQVYTEQGLKEALTKAGEAGAGNSTIILNGNLDMTSIEWTPVKVDGYNGADIVTVEGNNKVITGLTAPLFEGGFAGGSGIVIKNLTIDQSTIVSTNTQGSGAFVECSDSQDKIYLENCHLKNSSVSGSRTGGLVGWTSGYSNQNDGPVKSYITFKECSVVNCTITGTSVGGLNGHAGASDWTYTNIENCTVTGCTLSSTDDGDWRVGVAVGTANVGEVTITELTESGNALTQTGKTAPEGNKRNYYGRLVPSTTGKLVIDGVQVISTLAQLKAILDGATTNTTLSLHEDIEGDVTITQKEGVNIVIDGNQKTFTGIMTTFGNGRQSGSETLTIQNVNFVAAAGASSCIVSPDRTVNNKYSYTHNVTVDNCTFKDTDGTVNCAAIRQEDGGDKNWIVKRCTVDETMHSILQVNNVAGTLTIDSCIVSSKNGANLNCCTNVEMNECNFKVKGYAVRFGVSSGGNLGEAKTYTINKSNLTSECDDNDAVIMFRASAVDATLTLTDTKLDGTNKISGNTNDTKINGSY